jgi:capsular exopolysaccharide synthesis family protein
MDEMFEKVPNERRLGAGRSNGRGEGALPPQYDDDAFVDGGSIPELLGVLRRNLWLVLLIATVTLVPVVYLISREAPSYQATALVRLVDARRALTGGMEAGIADRALGNRADALLSQLEVLKGREVLGRVVDGEGLRLVPTGAGFHRGYLTDVRVAPDAAVDTVRLDFGATSFVARAGATSFEIAYGTPLEVGGASFTIERAPPLEHAALVLVSRDEAINMLSSRLVAVPRAMTDAVDLQYTTTDAMTAQRVVNSVAEVFQAYNAESSQQQSRRRRIFLEEQLRMTDSLLAEAQDRLSAFRSRETMYSSRDRIMAEQQGLMQLDIRREEMQADRRMYQSLLGQLQGNAGARGSTLRTLISSPGIAENPVVAAHYGRLVQYESERATLTTGPMAATATHPDVERLDVLIASTQAALLDAVESHIASLEARGTALDQLRSLRTSDIRGLPQTGVEEERLVQESDGIRRVSDQLRDELQRARMAEAIESGQVEIVHLAPLPRGPVQSGRELKVTLGVVLGLMLGLGGAFAREAMNTSIRRRGDIRKILRIPDLATIPRSNGLSGNGKLRLAIPGRTTTAIGATIGTTRRLVAAAEPGSSSAEGFRTLRTNLLFSRLGTAFKTIVVTSSGPGEGKSTVAANLAVTFAQQGKRVLLVDCDLRRPTLHQAFQTSREPGLTDLLDGGSVEEVIRQTSEKGLFLITSGEPPANPTELLGSDAMRKLIDHTEEWFDLVVLDTPPVLAASDSSILGSLADGVLVVVRAGHTARDAARDTIRQLDSVGANVVGAVLNDADAVIPGYDSYYRNYYYNYYGASKK